MKETILTALVLLAMPTLAQAQLPHDSAGQDIISADVVGERARRTIFDDLRDSAPRSIFDQLRDTAPHTPFDQLRDQAP